MNDTKIHDFTLNDKIHFIGVGGISMISLAEIFLKKGFSVSGSDIHYSDDIKKLEKLGLEFFKGHNAKNIENADIIVYTAAIKPGNCEYDAAVSKGKPMFIRSQILGYIMSLYSKPIAIAGTHGKTTVTSMISYIFEKASLDPAILVGAHLDLIGGTMKHGEGEYFIAEACEYHRSFLDFYPYCEVILNVEPDHLDYYKDADDYHSAYNDFMKNLLPGGFVVACGDDKDLMHILAKNNVRSLTFSISGNTADVTVDNINVSGKGTTFDIYIKEEKICNVSTKLFGKHNISNITAAITCAYGFGLDTKKAAASLENFVGADRRFEYRGQLNGASVYDDYAHHPTEISATVDTVKSVPHKKSFCVYQPHTYSRTKTFFNEFSSAFNSFDTVIFADIYAAREIDDGSVSSKMLAESAAAQGANDLYLGDFSAIASYLKTNAEKDDIVVIMGAGDVIEITGMLLN